MFTLYDIIVIYIYKALKRVVDKNIFNIFLSTTRFSALYIQFRLYSFHGFCSYTEQDYIYFSNKI